MKPKPPKGRPALELRSWDETWLGTQSGRPAKKNYPSLIRRLVQRRH
jgi:hypothetical protein